MLVFNKDTTDLCALNSSKIVILYTAQICTTNILTKPSFILQKLTKKKKFFQDTKHFRCIKLNIVEISFSRQIQIKFSVPESQNEPHVTVVT